MGCRNKLVEKVTKFDAVFPPTRSEQDTAAAAAAAAAAAVAWGLLQEGLAMLSEVLDREVWMLRCWSRRRWRRSPEKPLANLSSAREGGLSCFAPFRGGLTLFLFHFPKAGVFQDLVYMTRRPTS